MKLDTNVNLEYFKKAFAQNGWIKVESVFSLAEVEDILKHLHQFIEKYKDSFQKQEINYVDGLVNSLHCLHKYEDAFFKAIQENTQLKDFIGNLLSGEVECRGGEAFLKPAQKGLPSPMHQDNYYWCIQGADALTCWIALDDIDESNGGVTYYDGSHKIGLIDHEASFAPGSSQKVQQGLLGDLGTTTCPSLQKGDMLIHHSLTVHGSAANTSGRSRRGMTVQYKAISAGYDLDRKKHYEQSLQEQIKSRKT